MNDERLHNMITCDLSIHLHPPMISIRRHLTTVFIIHVHNVTIVNFEDKFIFIFILFI